MTFGRASVGDLAGSSEGDPDTSGEGARGRWRVNWRVPPLTTARVRIPRVRIWGRVLGTALAIGALAGTGQLGVAYGLGLLRFAREFPNDGVWSAQLTWVAWFAALAVLGGAAGGSWAARRHRLALGMSARITVVAAAGVGAAVVAPLVALPAASAAVLVRDQPALAAAVAAGLGVLVGVVTAVTALTVRLVAVSVTLLVVVVWLLALVSVVWWLVPAGDLPQVRLAVLDLPAAGGGSRSPVAVLTAPVLALLVCGAIAAAARSRGLPPLPTAIATTAAPGLLALVYLIGSPGLGDRAVQTSAYAASLMAVAVGLLVSLVVGVARMPERRGPELDPDAQDPGADAQDPEADAQGPEAAGSSASEVSEVSEKPVSPAAASESVLESRSGLEPPAWARFDEPAELTFPEAPSPVSGAPVSGAPVSAPPAWPAPADPEPTPLPDPPEQPSARPYEPMTLSFDLSPRSEPAPSDPQASEPEPSAPALPEPEPESEPVESEPAPKPSRRLKLPRLGRRPKQRTEQPAEDQTDDQTDKQTDKQAGQAGQAAPPEAPDQPEPALPAESGVAADKPVSPPAPPPQTPPKRRRRGEEEHLDWINSLAGGSEEADEPDTGRRRLRQDRDLGVSVDDLPEPPSLR